MLKNASILIIDDDPDVLTALRVLLKTAVKEVVTERRPENLHALLQQQKFDIIFLDMNFNSAINTGNEGLFWLKRIRETDQQVGIIMITAYGDIDLAVRSLKEGASDFITKPWHNERLLESLGEMLDKSKNKGSSKKNTFDEGITKKLIGESDVMQAVFYKIQKIAPTDANILILGENGTGKEMVAQAIHEQSLRRNAPFVKVDVGALTDSLFESELFGHKKGAFTDAREDRKGRFESADKGTLFLDEIGNISLQQQAKLLSVLQNRQVIRLGSNEPVPIDIRLISATNLPITDLANEQLFRRDLIYRINTVEITIPPLRKRKEDLVLLARHFARFYAEKYLKPVPVLESSCIDKLYSYHFPGNVRELQYTLERAIIMAEDNRLSADDLIFSPIETMTTVSEELSETKLSALEKNTILKVIEKNQGNITKAAKELGITRTALYRRLNKYEL
jgi:two-component system response regulator HydG